MSLLCGSNSALEALNSVKDSIKAALANKKGALSGLASAASALKSKLSALQAKVTSLDSFQAELAALTGATPAQIAAFKEKWKGTVANLDALVAQATSGIANALDICKDVPNVKKNPATGAIVQEAKESQTPNAAPAEAVAVVPTVVDNTTKTTVGNAAVVPKTTTSKFQESVQALFQEQVNGPLHKEENSKRLAVEEAKSAKAYKAVLLKPKSLSNSNELAAKADTEEEMNAIAAVKNAEQEYRIAANLQRSANKYYLYKQARNAGDIDENDAQSSIWEKLKDSNSPEAAESPGVSVWLEKIDKIIDDNSAIAEDYYNYIHNKSKN